MDITTRLTYLHQRLIQIERQAQTCQDRAEAQRLIVEWNLLAQVAKEVA